MQHDKTNTVFSLAADLVNYTSRHLFLTGKAGTGKTTFLRFVKETTQKNTVIVAPTGVAAINAGGVTMHSFFQLPFGPFVPSPLSGFNNSGQATDRHSLFPQHSLSPATSGRCSRLELLIIDEVSMVRCDMLDAIDVILRHFRRQAGGAIWWCAGALHWRYVPVAAGYAAARMEYPGRALLQPVFLRCQSGERGTTALH
jgi:hypothetical protein